MEIESRCGTAGCRRARLDEDQQDVLQALGSCDRSLEFEVGNTSANKDDELM